MLVSELQDKLHDIVSEWIFHEDQRVFSDAQSQRFLLRLVSRIDTLLHNAAAVLVAGDLYALPLHGVVEELVLGRLPALEYLLDDMVSVNVFAHFLYAVVEIIANHRVMDVLAYYFDNLLHRTSAVWILAQLHRFDSHLFDNLYELIRRALLRQLLNKVVAKAIVHELPAIRQRVVENLVKHRPIVHFL